MRRFYLIDGENNIRAEGVLFSAGNVAVSFVDQAPDDTSMSQHNSMARARAVHVGLGGRRIAWHQDEVPEGVEAQARAAYYLAAKRWVYVEA